MLFLPLMEWEAFTRNMDWDINNFYSYLYAYVFICMYLYEGLYICVCTFIGMHIHVDAKAEFSTFLNCLVFHTKSVIELELINCLAWMARKT